MLMSNRNRLAKLQFLPGTYRMLSGRIWDDREERVPSLLRVHVSNLRKKIEPDPSLPRYIHTEPGVGFRFSSQ